MGTLEASNCTCQFVRCIKPNKDKFSRATAVPTADNAWQSAMVLNQLRYTGMLDTLMIRKKGFPTRPDHATFWKKFQILSPNVPKTDVKKLFDDIGQRVPPADKPDLFKESHYYWGEASGNGPTNNKVGNGPARVLMKDATYRYLEKQVTETREKFVTVLASVSRAAHLCDQFDVAKTAAKIIAPVAVQFVKQDKEVAQAEIPKMDAEKSSMKQSKFKSRRNEHKCLRRKSTLTNIWRLMPKLDTRCRKQKTRLQSANNSWQTLRHSWQTVSLSLWTTPHSLMKAMCQSSSGSRPVQTDLLAEPDQPNIGSSLLPKRQ